MIKLVGALLLFAAAGAMSAAELVGSLSSPQNDYNLSYDGRERLLVFARSEADFRNAKIYVAEKTNGRWSSPEPIGFSEPRYSDSDPWLTPDGRTLFFVSNRPPRGVGEPKPDLDIWRSVRRGGAWSAPEHLAQLSSPGPELGVELHGQNLYFSSVRKGGKGGLDIYRAKLGPAGFEPPQLVEGPFNSTESDSDYTVSPDGLRAAFWRSKQGRGVLHVARWNGARWSDPVPLPNSVNIGPFNFTPSFSRDGRKLRFASTRVREGQEAGLADLYEVPLPPSL
jgi:Tol biopolymer transport system component